MIANRKERFSELQELIRRGEVDDGVLPVLRTLNSNSDYITTSSCSGRIQLIELPAVGEKRRSEVLAKWHEEVSFDDFRKAVTIYGPKAGNSDRGDLHRLAGTFDHDNVEGANDPDEADGDALLNGGEEGLLYLMVQSPIFHVEARSLISAIRLRNLAQASGFKYSTLRSVKIDRGSGEPVKITVELLTSELMHVPLGAGGKLLCGEGYLRFLHSRALAHLKRGKGRLNALEAALEDLTCDEKDRCIEPGLSERS